MFADVFATDINGVSVDDDDPVAVFGLAYEEGWLAFAEQLRARLKSAEFKEANVETVLEMLDVELSSRDAAVRRRSSPAPLEGELTENVVSFPGQRT